MSDMGTPQTNALQHLFDMLTNIKKPADPNAAAGTPGGAAQQTGGLLGGGGNLPVADPQAWTKMGAGNFTPPPTNLSSLAGGAGGKGGGGSGGSASSILTSLFGA